jgi:hypothetical protein
MFRLLDDAFTDRLIKKCVTVIVDMQRQFSLITLQINYYHTYKEAVSNRNCHSKHYVKKVQRNILKVRWVVRPVMI